MPLITLQRFKFAPDCTLGRLLINGKRVGFHSSKFQYHV